MFNKKLKEKIARLERENADLRATIKNLPIEVNSPDKEYSVVLYNAIAYIRSLPYDVPAIDVSSGVLRFIIDQLTHLKKKWQDQATQLTQS